jgi:PAS domain S-box-containing protein
MLVGSVKDYAIFMLDSTGRVASWNAGAQMITGYAAAEVIGQHFSQFYTPEDIARNHPDEELRLASERERYEEEGWRVCKDGSRFLAHVIITTMRDETGKLHGFSKITRNITERRNREAELRESEQRFRRAFDDAPIGMVLVTLRGHFLKANRAFCRMIGFPETELLGKDFQSVTHPADLEKNLSLVEETIAGKRILYQMEKRYFHKNGETIWARLNASLLREPDGQPRYFITQVENITELKLREAEREKLISELQQSLARVKTLSGLIPICGWCKNIRSDQGYWQSVEDYIHSQTTATFSHGICSDCRKKFLEQIEQRGNDTPELPFV